MNLLAKSEKHGETCDENYYIYENVFFKRRKQILQQPRNLTVLLFRVIQVRRSFTSGTDLQPFKMH